MTLSDPVAIVMAAGHGTRMRSERPKVLHEVCGRPILQYVLDAVTAAGVRSTVVVVGPQSEEIRQELADRPEVYFAVQEHPRGTGDAVRAAYSVLQDYRGPALVVVGDGPLLRPEPLAELLQLQRESQAACVLGTSVLPNPTGFGRILRNADGSFRTIVEQRDCTPEQAAVTEVNPSCYVFELPRLWEALSQLTTANAQGEYYVTDVPEILIRDGQNVLAKPVLDPDDIHGINERKHLAQAHLIMQSRVQERLMHLGVTIVDPSSTSIDGRASIAPDTVIYPFTVIIGDVRIGRRCRIGPFAHIRPGVQLGDDVVVGAFVEVNRSHLENAVQVRHLSYLGDTQIGPGTNVGAGVVTANFDGTVKHPTQIGARAFIGSNSTLIAPVKVGSEAVVGAGAVVTKGSEIAEKDVVIGVPARSLKR